MNKEKIGTIGAVTVVLGIGLVATAGFVWSDTAGQHDKEKSKINFPAWLIGSGIVVAAIGGIMIQATKPTT